MVKICLDTREHDLILSIPNVINTNNLLIDFEVKDLQIGDVEIRDSSNGLLCLIERKSLSDLASSITDGRYREQSLRMKEAMREISDHDKYYLIEGDFSQFSRKARYHSRIKPSTLLGVMASLSYGKRFSVVRTMNLQETAEWIVYFTKKVSQIHSERNERNERNEPTLNAGNAVNYSSVIVKQKCKNITPENIDEIFLCQIPYIQSVTARGLVDYFGSFYELQKQIQEKTDHLENIRINKRKLSSRVIQSLRTYIGATQKEIKVETE